MERHFYTNIDINSVVTPFLNRVSELENPTEEALWPFVDQYAVPGSQITDILFDIFCQYSGTDSRIWTDYAGKFEQKEENGVSVDYTELYRGTYALNKKFGLDPYRIWFDRCRHDGLHPWISIRMNDCHCPDDEACFLRSDFFYTARENGWMVGEKYGYYRWCFDYAVPEVRRMMLDYIREQIMRYDTDGLELDFSREIICFDYQIRSDCAEIMNGFIREVRDIVTEAEEKYGHKIRIGARLMRDIEQSKAYGFDAATWVKEGLIDMICVCPRWATCDSEMPIDEWKRRFPDTEISAGVTDLILTSTANVGLSRATVAGYALKYLNKGADSMYLFNFFMLPDEGDTLSPTNAKFTETNRTCGSADTASSLPYRFIVAPQDIAPAGFKPYHPLPLSTGSEGASLSIDLGAITESMKYAVIIGFTEGNPENAEIRLNGKSIRLTECTHGAVDAECAPYCSGDTTLYRAEIEAPSSPKLAFTFASANSGNVTVSYLEVETY